MNHVPALSFIIPCYNSEKYVSATLDSILSQPCKDYEIIIIDDGSTDQSPSILDNYKLKFPSISVIHKENEGVSCARNDGFRQAKGKYIAFLDSDDCLCTNVYDQTLNDLLLQDMQDIIGFGWIKANTEMSKGTLVSSRNQNYLKDNLEEYNARIRCSHFCSFLYRKSIISNEPFPPGCSYNEDFVFLFLTTRTARNIYSVDKYWFLYRNNETSLIHTQNIHTNINDRINAWNWGKERCTKRKDVLDCEGNIFSDIAQYINYSCKIGFTPSTALETISSSSILDEIMADYDDFWKVESLAALYNQFIAHPYRTFLKMRLLSLPESMIRQALKIPKLYKIYMSLRYKTPLEKYYS